MSEGYGQATGAQHAWLRRKLPQVSLFRFGRAISHMPDAPIGEGETCKRIRLYGVSSLLNIQISAGVIAAEGQTPYTAQNLPAYPGTVAATPINKWPQSSPLFLKPLTLVPQNIPHTFLLGPGLDVSEASGNRNGVAMADEVDIEVCIDPNEYFSEPFDVGPFQTIASGNTEVAELQFFDIDGSDSHPTSPGYIPPAGILTECAILFDSPSSSAGFDYYVYKNGASVMGPLYRPPGSFTPDTNTLVGYIEFNGITDVLDFVAVLRDEPGEINHDQYVHATMTFGGQAIESGIEGELVVQVQADYIGTWWDRELCERLLANLRIQEMSPTNIVTLSAE